MNIKTFLLFIILIIYLLLINKKNIANKNFIFNKFYNNIKKNKNEIKRKNLNKNILCSYIITIPKRLNNVNNIILPNLNFSPKTKIFNAILKENINKEELIRNKKLNQNTNLTNGQISCHLSHIMVMSKFIKTNYKYCLIFEDDLEKPKKMDYASYIQEILDYVEKDTDLIYLGSCFNLCIIDQKTTFKGLKRCFRPMCQHSYIISRGGALKILDNYNSVPQMEPIDIIIASMILNNKLKSYCLSPPLFFQNREELGTTLAEINLSKNNLIYILASKLPNQNCLNISEANLNLKKYIKKKIKLLLVYIQKNFNKKLLYSK
jgi:GR25 family glycosyltransferase involved in LPS biosynthesis